MMSFKKVVFLCLHEYIVNDKNLMNNILNIKIYNVFIQWIKLEHALVLLRNVNESVRQKFSKLMYIH